MPDLKSGPRSLAKAIMPNTVVSFIRGCRYRGYLAHTDYVLKLRRFRINHERANAAAPDSAIVLPGGCIIRVPHDAAEIRDAFEHFGWRDPDMVDEFIGFMEVASSAKVLWDIGALFGLFSLAFTLGSPERRALAFEPNPVSRGKLEECLKANPAAHVQCFDFPVGLPGETVEFERGFHFTAVPGLSVRPSDADVVRRETASIDELIEKNLDPPDLIKIDVEGHEFEVLRGARTLLSSRKPRLSIELHPDLLNHKGTPALAIAEYLEGFGYVFHNTRLKRVRKDFFARQDNFRIFAS